MSDEISFLHGEQVIVSGEVVVEWYFFDRRLSDAEVEVFIDVNGLQYCYRGPGQWCDGGAMVRRTKRRTLIRRRMALDV